MRLFWIVLICQALYSIALRGSRPIVSLYADIMGASPLIIGFLVSSFALLPMLFAIQAGKWLDNYGAKRIALLGSVGMIISLVLPVFFPTLLMLFVNQFIIGISHVCVLVSLQKTIGNLPGNRDFLIASFSIAGSIGEFIGPSFTGLLFEQSGFRVTFIVMIITVVVSTLIVTLLPANKSVQNKGKDSHKTTEKKSSTLAMLKKVNLRKALIISGLVLYSKDLFVGYFPVYGNNIGLTPSQIGLVISLVSGMAIVVRMLQFTLVKKFGRSLVLFSTLILSGIAFVLVPTSTSMIYLSIFALMLGAGLGLGQPLSIVYTLNVSPVPRHGEVLGLRLTFNRASQFVAPFVFGAIGQVAGIAPVFYLSGAFLLLGSYFTRMKEDNDSGDNE
ncbi:MFS transporter [Tenuibacillus multivorans]|uniref:Predicted arabinose efflux permease, MFS family n=1 Tax=Tenuibacillus multivorans TaxID=237069 RepID=A0A1H0BNY0_9BACI|nr:MFS transporter [Tenuibacillus multivorans]GEL77092.1 MFS transporter [Tenuibacillus multivorans]SDN47377.1 Predicted arabinose efflux permease, MFS family [Tenuibacillus multivorans]